MKTSKILSYLLIIGLVFSGQPLSSEPALSLEHVAIPESLGKVDERFVGTSNRWVIHIQDVHAHFTAQENIAAILDHLNAVYGLRTVAFEGGWSQTSYPKTWSIPTSQTKQQFASALLEEDLISGPAYAAMFSQTPLTLFGIEDPEIYEANRETYVEHLNHREDIEKRVKKLDADLLEEKKNTYNPDLLTFDRGLRGFRKGEKAEKFLPTLLSLATDREINIAELPQVDLFSQIIELEGALDKQRLESEADRLMKSFKAERLSYEELLRSGKIPADRLEFYDESQRFLQILELRDQISYKDFFDQLEELISLVKEVLFTSEEEAALDGKAEDLGLASRIIMFKATPQDIIDFEAIDPEVIDGELEARDLLGPLDLALDFYDVALERDDVFFERITTTEQLSGDIAVVAGGFHTKGLSAQLREAEISYIVITPDLGGQMPKEELYFKRLTQEVVTQTLSEIRDRQNNQQDAVIAEAMQKLERNELSGYSDGVRHVESKQLRTVKPGAISMSDFLALETDAQRLQALAAFAQNADTATETTLQLWPASFVDAALADPFDTSVLQGFVANPKNRAIVLGLADGVLPSGKARIRTELGAETALEFAESRQAQRQFKQVDDRVAGVGAEFLEEPILIAPAKIQGEHIRGIPLVLNAILRGQLRAQGDVAAEFFTRVSQLLSNINSIAELLSASA